MTPCETYRENLRAYLDGELPLRSRLAVRWHLARCASCREEVREMEQISRELKAGDAAPFDAALRDKILASVPDAPPVMPTEEAAPRKRRPRPLLLASAAAVAVAAWFVLYPTLTQMQQKASDTASATGNAVTKAPLAMRAAPSKNIDVNGNEPEVMESGRVASVAAPSQETAKMPAAPKPVQMAQAASKNELEESRRDYRKTLGGGGERPAAPALDTLVPTERQVHKEASLTLEVDKVEAKSDTIEEMVKTEGGYVASNELSTGEDGLKTAALTTKIPVTDFESFLGKLTTLGDVKAKEVRGEDITEKMSDQEQTQRVLKNDISDTQSRLRTRQSRAQTRADLEQLRDLKIRAAQSEARLTMLKKLATLATLTIELRAKPKPSVSPPATGGFLDEMSETGQAAVHSFLQAARLPILLLVWLLVYAPVWMLLAIAYRYAFRH